jgi:AraC-like DNA-binding protein
MTTIVQKSAIPHSKVLVAKRLEETQFDRTFHSHPEYQLFMVLRGQGTRFIGDNIKPFGAGDLVFTGPNLPHIWKNDNTYFDKQDQPKTLGIVVYFHEDFLGDIIHEKEEMQSIRHLLERAERGLEILGKTKKVVGQMMAELLEINGISQVILLLNILNTIAECTETTPIAHIDYVQVKNKAETDRMNMIYDYVLKNFRKKINLEEVSDLVNMTPTSFSRYFKSRVNKSFSDYLKEVRIDYARKLINQNEMSINQVSYESGYNTLSNFNKQFKEVTGQTPLHYRNEYLKIKL